MADEADRAQPHEEAIRAEAIRRAMAAPKGPPPVILDGVHFCADCSEVIPPARVAALPGIGLCVTCQQDREEAGEWR